MSINGQALTLGSGGSSSGIFKKIKYRGLTGEKISNYSKIYCKPDDSNVFLISNDNKVYNVEEDYILDGMNDTGYSTVELSNIIKRDDGYYIFKAENLNSTLSKTNVKLYSWGGSDIGVTTKLNHSENNIRYSKPINMEECGNNLYMTACVGTDRMDLYKYPTSTGFPKNITCDTSYGVQFKSNGNNTYAICVSKENTKNLISYNTSGSTASTAIGDVAVKHLFKFNEDIYYISTGGKLFKVTSTTPIGQEEIKYNSESISANYFLKSENYLVLIGYGGNIYYMDTNGTVRLFDLVNLVRDVGITLDNDDKYQLCDDTVIYESEKPIPLNNNNKNFNTFPIICVKLSTNQLKYWICENTSSARILNGLNGYDPLRYSYYIKYNQKDAFCVSYSGSILNNISLLVDDFKNLRSFHQLIDGARYTSSAADVVFGHGGGYKLVAAYSYSNATNLFIIK